MASFIVTRHSAGVVMRIPRARDDAWYSRAQPSAAGHYTPDPIILSRRREPNSPEPGDIVWIVTDLVGPGHADETHRSPLALEARLVVAVTEVQPSGAIRLIPSSESRFYRLADARPALQKLVLHSRSDAPTEVEPYLQGDVVESAGLTARRLCDDLALTAWAARLQSEPYDYISYRQADGTRAAFEHAQKQLAQGRIVFFDRWGMPEHLIERREQAPDPALESFLTRQMEGARTVWCVHSPAYMEADSYSANEAGWVEAMGRGREVEANAGHHDLWPLTYRLTDQERAAAVAQAKDIAFANGRAKREALEEAERQKRNAKARLRARQRKGNYTPEPTPVAPTPARKKAPAKKAARKHKPRYYPGIGRI